MCLVTPGKEKDRTQHLRLNGRPWTFQGDVAKAKKMCGGTGASKVDACEQRGGKYAPYLTVSSWGREGVLPKRRKKTLGD